MKLVAIIAGIILAVAWIFYVASDAVPSWSQITIGSYTYAYGLWQYCTTYSGSSTCANINCPSATGDNDYCSRILASRAFMTIACILSGITTICLFICECIDKKISRILSLAAKVLAFVCVIMGIVGVGTGGSAIRLLSQNTNQLNFSTGFALGVVAIVINLVGAIVSLFIKQS
ncbi:unnamed protein product [Adineta steineri]|uniref:Claudin n=1 Tax=Adineta steineri TaxID=433720 RepID=A0A815RVB6_9BILA|nr:unnamed protein product [Adineta steineri]CAF1502098.1 unnamed protein product [Adineta steineri]CAF3595904.1 unnamed protein product [Adineta steineri]CAF4185801.1 unnamed protein product [Adineta steineri]